MSSFAPLPQFSAPLLFLFCRPNVDQLDIAGASKEWLEESFNPSGYDMEDSSDPDTLPQLRNFTRDELHRVLQDVEESATAQTDAEDQLLQPMLYVGMVYEQLLRARVMAGVAAVIERRPELASMDALPFDITDKTTLENIIELEEEELLDFLEHKAKQRESKYVNPKTPAVTPFVSPVPGAAAPLDDVASKNPLATNMDQLESSKRALQQHNAGALASHQAAVANQYEAVDHAAMGYLRQLALAQTPEDAPKTIEQLKLHLREARRDTRSLTSDKHAMNTDAEVEETLFDFALMRSDNHEIAANADHLRQAIRKFSASQIEALYKEALTLSKEDFQARIEEIAAASAVIDEVVYNTEQDLKYGPAPKAKVESVHARRSAEGGEEGAAVDKRKEKEYGAENEFGDDDGRYELASDFEGGEVNAPGLTVSKAIDMLEDIAARDVWAAYHDYKLPEEYYRPVVLGGDVKSVASTVHVERFNYRGPGQHEPLQNRIASSVEARIKSIVASKIISPAKLRRLRKGLLMYSGITEDQLRVMETATTPTYYEKTMALHPQIKESVDKLFRERMAKYKDTNKDPRLSLFTEDDLNGYNVAVAEAKANGLPVPPPPARKPEGADTASEDEIGGLSRHLSHKSDRARNMLKTLVYKYGLPLDEATIMSDKIIARMDARQDPSIAVRDQSDDSGTPFESDYDDLVEDAILELRNVMRQGHLLTHPVSLEDQQTLEAPRNPIILEQATQEALEAPDFEAEVAEYRNKLKGTQADALRRIYQLDPVRARELVASAMSFPMTPGANAAQVAENHAKDARYVEDKEDEEGNGVRSEDDAAEGAARTSSDEDIGTDSSSGSDTDAGGMSLPKGSIDFVSELQTLQAKILAEDGKALARARKLASGHVSNDDDLEFEFQSATSTGAATGSGVGTGVGVVSGTGTGVGAGVGGKGNVGSSSSYVSDGETSGSTSEAYADGPSSNAAASASASASGDRSAIRTAPLNRGEFAPAFIDDYIDSDVEHARIAKWKAKLKVAKDRLAADEADATAVLDMSNAKEAIARAEAKLARQFHAVDLYVKINRNRFSARRDMLEYRRSLVTNQKEHAMLTNALRDLAEGDADKRKIVEPPGGPNEPEEEQGVGSSSGGEEGGEEDGVDGDDANAGPAGEDKRAIPASVEDLLNPTQVRPDPFYVRAQQNFEGNEEKLYLQRMEDNVRAKFMAGTLDDDNYVAMMAINRGREYSLGLESSDREEMDARNFRRDIMLNLSGLREDRKEEEELYNDDDSMKREPGIDADFQLDSVTEHKIARRVQPYDLPEIEDSDIPPAIGIEQQTNIYNLHKLDPVTFHPRWLARRLNIPPAAVLAILKGQDALHTQLTIGLKDKAKDADFGSDTEQEEEANLFGSENEMSEEIEVISDVQVPHPPETLLSPDLDDEFYFAIEAPHLIGRVSWDNSVYRDPAWASPAWADGRFVSDIGMQSFMKEQESRNRRWASFEQRQDALEKASFARFGPVHWSSGRASVHRPPKLPREIISTTIFPPTRFNWILTGIGERKKNVYSIQVRDRDGYLRHPTHREFKTVRARERDLRLPFFWRRHHVIAKVPEISNTFIDQALDTYLEAEDAQIEDTSGSEGAAENLDSHDPFGFSTVGSSGRKTGSGSERSGSESEGAGVLFEGVRANKPAKMTDPFA